MEDSIAFDNMVVNQAEYSIGKLVKRSLNFQDGLTFLLDQKFSAPRNDFHVIFFSFWEVEEQKYDKWEDRVNKVHF